MSWLCQGAINCRSRRTDRGYFRTALEDSSFYGKTVRIFATVHADLIGAFVTSQLLLHFYYASL